MWTKTRICNLNTIEAEGTTVMTAHAPLYKVNVAQGTDVHVDAQLSSLLVIEQPHKQLMKAHIHYAHQSSSDQIQPG